MNKKLESILIFSINGDQSTCSVMDWIDYLGGTSIRLNGKDLLNNKIDISLNGLSASINNTLINNSQGVWYRRIGNSNLKLKIKNKTLKKEMNSHLLNEFYSLIKAMFNSLNEKDLLSSPKNSKLDKIIVLQKASDFGLIIPDTMVTNKKSELKKFLTKHTEVIVKNIGDSESFSFKDDKFTTFTSLINQEKFNQLPQSFFPSIFQNKINKDFEIRVFHLNKVNFSMAIFSQNNKNTIIDFRRYSATNPNRKVPFKLPKEIEIKINLLMDSLNLRTGSIDIIKSKEGNYVFLEINPVGQFGMVSIPCNYYLEKKIAKYLLKF